MKRYIRTKDGKIHEIETGYAKGNVVCYGLVPQETVAESDNIFDLIIKGDLVEYKDDDNDTWLEDIKKSWEDYKETSLINKIYTKQGDNYILVWDKERGII